jgi:hypothetical protein
LFSHFLFVVRNHQSRKLGPGSVGQAAHREKERKLSSEVASLAQSSLEVASLAHLSSEVASLVQLSSEVTSLAQLQSSSEVTG